MCYEHIMIFYVKFFYNCIKNNKRQIFFDFDMKIVRANLFSVCILFVFFLIASHAGYSGINTEKEDTLNTREWIHLDPNDDGVAGISLNKAYQLLAGRPSKTILVAIIDSGFDLDQEDLSDGFWINEGEIPDNGIDDDRNGYIDDVHGWNFIGGPEENVIYDTYELTREYNRLNTKYGDQENVSGAEYEYWLKIREEFLSKKDQAEKILNTYTEVIHNLPRYYVLIQNYLDVDVLTSEAVNKIETEDSIILEAKSRICRLLDHCGDSADSEIMVRALLSTEEKFSYDVNYGYNTGFDPRPLVKDNYQDKRERFYGNNRVNDYTGRVGDHGTHVAGIIAANRYNNIGTKGVADNVKIIPLRTVPNGDERDKDVANAIYYAVNNGARVINMSFGKPYSPERDIVEKAIRYAEKKGVLIIHAAGNDSENKDTTDNFPTRKFIKGNREAWNVIEVAASSMNIDEKLTAKFTNYGKSSVDLFAPGVEVYSTLPGNNYDAYNGTSMAAPVVSGVAALLFSYFPELSAKEVKEVLLESVKKFDQEVYLPGSTELVEFSTLSKTGGVINAYEAVKLAQNRIKLETR